jgi:hypothetical protein
MSDTALLIVTALFVLLIAIQRYVYEILLRRKETALQSALRLYERTKAKMEEQALDLPECPLCGNPYLTTKNFAQHMANIHGIVPPA